jgi:hypothetical protein
VKGSDTDVSAPDVSAPDVFLALEAMSGGHLIGPPTILMCKKLKLPTMCLGNLSLCMYSTRVGMFLLECSLVRLV